MTTSHLLSTSLFTELFQHNIVSSDGQIIANEEQLQNYYSFLVQQSKDRTTRLFIERKNLVNDAQDLLNSRPRTKKENNLLKKILNELDLKIDDEILAIKEPKKPKKRYVGPAEPKKSAFEKQIETDLQKAKVLKRDLKILDEWLEKLSHCIPTSEIENITDWKTADKHFRKRIRKRMCDMEDARMKLVMQHYDEYDNFLKTILNPGLIAKVKYLSKKFRTTRADSRKKQELQKDSVDEAVDSEAETETQSEDSETETEDSEAETETQSEDSKAETETQPEDSEAETKTELEAEDSEAETKTELEAEDSEAELQGDHSEVELEGDHSEVELQADDSAAETELRANDSDTETETVLQSSDSPDEAGK